MTQATLINPIATRFDNGSVRVTIPIYVGIEYDTARKIMEILRDRITSPTKVVGSLKVQTAGMTDSQRQMEARLRMDYFQLRQMLFSSWRQGISLDLALRLQDEIGDEVKFIDDETIQEAVKISIDRYRHYAQTDESQKD